MNNYWLSEFIEKPMMDGEDPEDTDDAEEPEDDEAPDAIRKLWIIPENLITIKK